MKTLFWIAMIIAILFWLRHLYRMRKKNNARYVNDIVYSENEFPIRLAILKSGYRLNNDKQALKRAATVFNNVMDYNVFDVRVEEVNKKDYGKRKDTLYVAGAKYAHANHEAFDGPGEVLAHANLPPYKTLCIDASEDWDEPKLFSTLLHELGHSLGLLHSPFKDSVMYEYFSYHKTLGPSDVANLNIIYPFMMSSVSRKRFRD